MEFLLEIHKPHCIHKHPTPNPLPIPVKETLTEFLQRRSWRPTRNT